MMMHEFGKIVFAAAFSQEFARGRVWSGGHGKSVNVTEKMRGIVAGRFDMPGLPIPEHHSAVMAVSAPGSGHFDINGDIIGVPGYFHRTRNGEEGLRPVKRKFHMIK